MSSAPSDARLGAAILGCSGPRLGDAESRFFRRANPLGFILFGRNCESPDQVRALVRELRDAVGRPDAPVLIDQEGGRVARLKPPHWRETPAAGTFASLFPEDPDRAIREVYANARRTAEELRDLGITVNCAPVCDIPTPETYGILGDRTYGETVEAVTLLAREVCRGLRDGGVFPVLKHIPGYGRAKVDPHRDLPVVAAGREDLEAADFAVFRHLSDMPVAMSAHVVYTAFDEERPATLSPAVIGEAVRRTIGFDGLLLTDDLNMGALSGSLGDRAKAAIDAGCDVVLHCSGELAEMEEVAEGAGHADAAALRRISRMRDFLGRGEGKASGGSAQRAERRGRQ